MCSTQGVRAFSVGCAVPLLLFALLSHQQQPLPRLPPAAPVAGFPPRTPTPASPPPPPLPPPPRPPPQCEGVCTCADPHLELARHRSLAASALRTDFGRVTGANVSERQVRVSSASELAYATVALTNACILLRKVPAKKKGKPPASLIGTEVFARGADTAEQWRAAQRIPRLDTVWAARTREEDPKGMARLWLEEDVGRKGELITVSQPTPHRFAAGTVYLVGSVGRLLCTNLNHLFNRLAPIAWVLENVAQGGTVVWPVTSADVDIYSGQMGLGPAVPLLMRMVGRDGITPVVLPELFAGAAAARCDVCFDRVVVGHPRWAPSLPLRRSLLVAASVPSEPPEPRIAGLLQAAMRNAGTASASPPLIAPGSVRAPPAGGWRAVVVERDGTRSFGKEGLRVIADTFAAPVWNSSVVRLGGAVARQVAAVAEADVLVAASGAAVSWAVVMRPGGVVVELGPYRMCGVRAAGVNVDANEKLFSGGVVRWAGLVHVATRQISAPPLPRESHGIASPSVRVSPARIGRMAAAARDALQGGGAAAVQWPDEPQLPGEVHWKEFGRECAADDPPPQKPRKRR